MYTAKSHAPYLSQLWGQVQDLRPRRARRHQLVNSLLGTATQGGSLDAAARELPLGNATQGGSLYACQAAAARELPPSGPRHPELHAEPSRISLAQELRPIRRLILR